MPLCQHLSWMRVLAPDDSTLRPRCQCPPLHCYMSRYNRWVAARDWQEWTIMVASTLVLAPLCHARFPSLFLTLLFSNPFPHLFHFVPSPLDHSLLFLSSSSSCKSLSHPFKVLEASLLPWFPSFLLICASYCLLFLFCLCVACCLCLLFVLGLL